MRKRLKRAWVAFTGAAVPEEELYEPFGARLSGRVSMLVRGPVERMVRFGKPGGMIRLTLYGAGFHVDAMTPRSEEFIDEHLRRDRSSG